METPNFDKQAEKFLVTQVKKLKKINVIDITGHDVPYLTYHFILRINHKPVAPEMQQSTVQYSTVFL